VDVSVFEHPGISWTTAADGGYLLAGIPSNEVVHAMASPPDADHWGTVAAFQFFGVDVVEDLGLTPDWMIQAVVTLVGINIDAGTGVLVVKAAAGTRVELPAVPGATAIVNDGGDFVLGDTVPDGGDGVYFLNVPAGAAEAVLEPPLGINCDTNGMGRNAFSPAMIVEGFLSAIEYECL
jgi:hypothetical protein